MTVYQLEIRDNDGGEVYLASAYGDLDAMAYHVRRFEKSAAGGQNLSALLTEVESIGGSTLRTVASAAQMDAELLTVVLKRKLAAERVRVTDTAE